MRNLIDNSDNLVVNSYDYDSFGVPFNWSETISNEYTYTGREYNSESGDYYYRERTYHAGIGRFGQEDPAGFIGGTNFYSYCVNNPVKYNDPTGMLPNTYEIEKYATYKCSTQKEASFNWPKFGKCVGVVAGVAFEPCLMCLGSLGATAASSGTMGYFATLKCPLCLTIAGTGLMSCFFAAVL